MYYAEVVLRNLLLIEIESAVETTTFCLFTGDISDLPNVAVSWREKPLVLGGGKRTANCNIILAL